MSVGVKGHSRWRLMVGVCFVGGEPLTEVGKGIAGSSKMASNDGSVIFGGEPLTPMGKNRGRSTTEKRRDWNGMECGF